MSSSVAIAGAPAAKRQKVDGLSLGHVVAKEDEQSQKKAQILLDYLRKNRRPLNVISIVDNMHGALSKADVTALVSSSNPDVMPYLLRKEMGKSCAFLYVGLPGERAAAQTVPEEKKKAFLEKYLSGTPGTAGEEETLFGQFLPLVEQESAAMKSRIATLQAKINTAKEAQRKQKEETRLKDRWLAVQKEQADLARQKADVEKRLTLAEVNAKNASCSSSSASTEVDQVLKKFDLCLRTWIKRKKAALELADALLGEGDVARADFLDSLGMLGDKEEIPAETLAMMSREDVTTLKIPKD
ncbi:unnamed protein product [Amoebophrya sp. A25]|nr:unnamed protein product [Amoebophrya sp. A25]|eukprot:GSA25T00024872001.1